MIVEMPDVGWPTENFGGGGTELGDEYFGREIAGTGEVVEAGDMAVPRARRPSKRPLAACQNDVRDASTAER